MTERTMNQPTPCEKAAQHVVENISNLISVAYAEFHVRDQIGKEETFRAIMAGYLENKSLRDWCTDLGIDVPEGSRARWEDHEQ